MAYTRVNWEDLPSTATPRNATNLNKMDAGIKENDDKLLGNKSQGKIVVEDVTCKNLFDKNNFIPSALFVANAGNAYQQAGTLKGFIFDVTNLSTITISKISSQRFGVGASTNYPAVGVSATLLQDVDYQGTTLTLDVSSYNYIVVSYFSTTLDTLTEQQILDTIQIEKGSTATAYVPYNKYGYNSHESMGDIVVDDISCKNLLNTGLMTTFTSASSSEWYSLDGVGQYSTAANILKGNVYYDIEAGETYTLSVYQHSNVDAVHLVTVSGNTVSLLVVMDLTTGYVTFTASSNVRIYPRIRCINANTTTYCIMQLEKGSTVTNFTSYKGFSYERGANKNGKYIKYDDGTLECWGTTTLSNVAVTTATGSMYRSDYQSSMTFPISFTSIDMCNLFLQGSTYASMIAPEGSPTTNYTQAYYIYRSTSTTLSSATIGYHAIGRWK